jgi:hypothetical protein
MIINQHLDGGRAGVITGLQLNRPGTHRNPVPISEQKVPAQTRVLRALLCVRYAGPLGVEYTWIDRENRYETDKLADTILKRDCLRREMQAIKGQRTKAQPCAAWKKLGLNCRNIKDSPLMVL